MKRKQQALLIGVIAFLLISIAVATFFVKQNQDNRQRASGNETITASPSTTLSPTPTGPTLDAEEWNFLTILNQHRQSIGVQPLRVSVKLTTAAEWMSNDMATSGKLDHVDSLGRNINTRLPAFGYQAQRIGENIAWVGPTGQEAFDKWLASTQGHKEEMENASSTAIGIARVQSSNNWYWTTDFGTTLDAEITPTATPSVTDTPSITASPSITSEPTVTNSTTPTNTPTATPTTTPTPTPTNTPTPTPTNIPTPTTVPTFTPTSTPTSTPPNTPTLIPNNTPTPTATSTPTLTPTIAPTATSIPLTATPTIANPGGILQTIGILGGAMIVIIGGIFLLLL